MHARIDDRCSRFFKGVELPIHSLLVRSRSARDPRAAALLADAHALGFTHLTGIECAAIYFLHGDPSPSELDRLAAELLCDPVAQSYCWRAELAEPDEALVIETALRPGVTDTVSEQIVRGSKELGITRITQAATGQQFRIHSLHPLTEADLHALARRLLVNPVIHRYALGRIAAVFPQPAEPSDRVEIIPVRNCTDAQLLAVSRDRRAALDLNEMRAVQNYFRLASRDPSDVEFEMIAQTWSEHCSHKTFKAKVEVGNWKLEDGRQTSNLQSPTSYFQIDGLLKTFIRRATDEIAAPWVRSAFVDNAGIIEFDDEYEVSFKVETHNHPSAIEPFGGANTGIGGVIRDVLGVSAKPIAATDILCFGPQNAQLSDLPEGVLHPRLVRSGVVAGVQDYGNKIGIPTVNGAVWYDPGYTANPLVFCGCVGLAPKGKHANHPHPGDRVIVLGGRTGRDGLRGATFSSMTMDAQTGGVSGASVQIGDPITEKGLIEVIIRARDRSLYTAVTDCGAGGLSSAVGEIAQDTGAEVDLSGVRLKYTGLAPWEIWLSEAQERMVLAVPAEKLPALESLCATYDVELTDIGVFSDTHRLIVRHGGKIVLDLSSEFLFKGMPQRTLVAAITGDLPPVTRGADLQPPAGPLAADTPVNVSPDPASVLLDLLSHPNIASKADIIHLYDHQVQGATVVKPLTGARDDGPADACVLKPLGTRGTRGIVLSNGINPEFGLRDSYRMAVSVVDEAIRNAVAVGADPQHIALLDNFCWGDPLRPETMGQLIQASRGCYDAARHYGTPFISGKDSLNNEYLGTDGLRHAIPPTLLISAIGVIEDVGCAVTMDWKEPGNAIYLLGQTRAEFGGSHYSVNSQQSTVDSKQSAAPPGSREFSGIDSPVPEMPRHAPALYRALHRAMQARLVRACHDLSEGGMAVALAEMCIGGRLGCSILLEEENLPAILFSESNGRLLAEVQRQDCKEFESYFHDDLAKLVFRIGQVGEEPRLHISTPDRTVLALPVSSLLAAWNRDGN